jgi:hypothetical protein
MIETKPQSHLINIIHSTIDHHPNFVLFLGAGTSKSSGVKLAGELIKEWRNSHYQMYKKETETIEEHFKRFHWSNSAEEYSILFENLYDEPSQRREFIESCIKNASPSWGYIYLVNLLRKKTFNTVFTTNFDDLLNEACYQFSSEVRPIVCAHDSSISSIRITSSRPKIVKLHGDFLFDNIKNTIRELETLEQNTQDKFKQYASEFGFIVMGYSGNDRSIMDTFNTLLRFDHYFPHGIYWCIRKGTTISSKVENLARFPKFKIVEIDGFDEFFAELNNSLGLPLQPEMTNPYNALALRLNTLIEKINLPENKDPNPIIERDINNLGRHISKLTSNTNEEPETVVDIAGAKEKLPIPYGLLANLSTRDGDFETALKYRIKELSVAPTARAIAETIKVMYLSKRLDCKEDLLNKIYNSEEHFSKDPMQTFDIAIELIRNKEFDDADKVLDFGYEIFEKYGGNFMQQYYFLNKLQIIKHRGKDYSQIQIKSLRNFAEKGDIYSRIGALILLDENQEVEEIMLGMNKKEDLLMMVNWPILDFIRDKFKDSELLEMFKK